MSVIETVLIVITLISFIVFVSGMVTERAALMTIAGILILCVIVFGNFYCAYLNEFNQERQKEQTGCECCECGKEWK